MIIFLALSLITNIILLFPLVSLSKKRKVLEERVEILLNHISGEEVDPEICTHDFVALLIRVSGTITEKSLGKGMSIAKEGELWKSIGINIKQIHYYSGDIDILVKTCQKCKTSVPANSLEIDKLPIIELEDFKKGIYFVKER